MLLVALQSKSLLHRTWVIAVTTRTVALKGKLMKGKVLNALDLSLLANG